MFASLQLSPAYKIRYNKVDSLWHQVNGSGTPVDDLIIIVNGDDGVLINCLFSLYYYNEFTTHCEEKNQNSCLLVRR